MNWPAFTSPWLLAGLAAIGLPILIHYLTRARPRRIVFPPYQFLTEACAGKQAVHRLRTIVLLTVRCLAILTLVLLFARPFLKPNSPAAEVEAAKRVVIILDASLSMRIVERGVPLFARAQAEAADVLRSLETGSEAGVILAGTRPRALLPALSRNIAALHEELVKSKPTYEAGDPAGALALAGQMLGGRGTIHVFSDFQESNWKSVRELPGRIVCRLRPIGGGPSENVAITAAQVVPASPVVGESSEIVCTVFNCTPRERQENVRLELGESTQNRVVKLPPFGSGAAAFNVSFPRADIFTGKVSLQPDDLREDDTRHLAVPVRKALQLLLISDTDAAETRSAAFFISRALVPSAQAAPGLNLVRRHTQDADRGMLETADVFLLVAPATLTGETSDVVSRRVREGAQLIVFLDVPNAAQLALPAFSPPFVLLNVVGSEEGHSLRAGPRKPFAEADAGDWAGLKFHRHYRTQIREAHDGDVMLQYEDGSAALTATPVGKGMAAFVNIPLTPDGGDLIGSPLFPALLHELLRTLRHGADDEAATPGNNWTLDAPTRGEAPVNVTDPEGRAVDAKVVSSGRLTRLALPPAFLPGIYAVQQSGAGIAAGAVNVDARESDIRPIAMDPLRNLPGGAGVSLIRDEDTLLGAIKTRPLWPQLAVTAAALIAIEMLLLAIWRGPRAKTTGRTDATQNGSARTVSGSVQKSAARSRAETAEVAS